MAAIRDPEASLFPDLAADFVVECVATKPTFRGQILISMDESELGKLICQFYQVC